MKFRSQLARLEFPAPRVEAVDCCRGVPHRGVYACRSRGGPRSVRVLVRAWKRHGKPTIPGQIHGSQSRHRFQRGHDVGAHVSSRDGSVQRDGGDAEFDRLQLARLLLLLYATPPSVGGCVLRKRGAHNGATQAARRALGGKRTWTVTRCPSIALQRKADHLPGGSVGRSSPQRVRVGRRRTGRRTGRVRR